MKKYIVLSLIKIVNFIIHIFEKKYNYNDFLILIISESNFNLALCEKKLCDRIEYSMVINQLTKYLKNVVLKMYCCSLTFYLAKNYTYAFDALLDIFIVDEFRKKLLQKRKKMIKL